MSSPAEFDDQLVRYIVANKTREEIVKLRERWSYGATVCVYFAFSVLVGFGATALCAALWILPVEALLGDFTSGGIRDGLIVTAIIVVPVFMSFAMEHVPKPDGTEELTPPY